jgi:polynucleotide 5'-hydroxyl-kinase GRC3/NOL9
MKRVRADEPGGGASTPLTLKRGERAALVGFAVVRVTRGALHVHGHVIGPGREALLRSSPDAGSSLVLEASQDGSGCEATLREPERPADTAPPPAAKPLPGPLRACAAGAAATFRLHGCEQPEAGVVTELPVAWRTAVANVVTAAAGGGRACVLVCGSQGAGKSTLVRLLVNALLQRVPAVQLLDGDCGQPELCPPGLLSLTTVRAPLLGPPALRLACSDAPQPHALRFVGEESAKGDPLAFGAALRSLLACAEAQQSPSAATAAPPPLVINTQGWVRGLGLELLCDLARAAEPTHVLQLQPPGGRSPLPDAPFWALPGEAKPRCRVHLLDSVSRASHTPAPAAADTVDEEELTASIPAARSSAEQRALLWAAWAHRCAAAASASGIGAKSDAEWCQLWTPGGGAAMLFPAVAQALAAAPPLLAPLRAMALRALDAPGLTPQDALRALNGSLVALSASADGDETAAREDGAPACLGLALVRSVDATGLLLLTPLGLEQAREARLLVLGRLALPRELLALPLPSQLCSPYLTPLALGQEGSGGGAMRSRNNLQRSSTRGPA